MLYVRSQINLSINPTEFNYWYSVIPGKALRNTNQMQSPPKVNNMIRQLVILHYFSSSLIHLGINDLGDEKL